MTNILVSALSQLLRYLEQMVRIALLCTSTSSVVFTIIHACSWEYKRAIRWEGGDKTNESARVEYRT